MKGAGVGWKTCTHFGGSRVVKGQQIVAGGDIKPVYRVICHWW
jgi:hypothetical protein